MERESLAELHVRIPRNLKDLMKEYVQLDAHKDISELTRDTLCEKKSSETPLDSTKSYSRKRRQRYD